MTNFTADSSKGQISGTFYSENNPIQQMQMSLRNKEFVDFSHFGMSHADVESFFACYKLNQKETTESTFGYQIVDFSYNDLKCDTINFIIA